jgi:hypothetical protein
MHRYKETTLRNVLWFRDALRADQLTMRPPFQRNPVWTNRQKAYLIDTILHEYPIPELYMQQTIDAKGNQQHIVVDGQQRIRSCLEFLEGKFALHAQDSAEWADMVFEDLSDAQKKLVYEYDFVVRMLPEMPESVLREVFVRLNRNVVKLNAQELRHATYWGPFIKTMEELAEHEFWPESGVFSADAVRRMADVEFISELAIAHSHGLQNKKESLSKWYEVYEEDFDAERETREVFHKVLGELSQILPDISRTRWKKRSDFYTLFLVFAQHVSTLPLPAGKRHSARKLLRGFASEVDGYLRDKKTHSGIARGAVKYALAVERAASDLSARRARAQQVDELLAHVW